ncbi:MAG TPA: hypothetical protein VGO67_13495 [Verrucomicrobiae bacterium]|jgi:hypothetical protein
MRNQLILSLALFCLAANRLPASVVVTKLDPPLAVGVPWYGDWDTAFQEISFGSLGDTNLVLTWGGWEMDLGFYEPSRVFIVEEPLPSGDTNVYGAVAALPLGTIVGSNIVATSDVSNDTWAGGSVTDDFSSDARYNTVGYVVSDDTVGDPPSVVGDVVGKEAVMAFGIFFNGQQHFGYIHFDFRPDNGWNPGYGIGGYVLGWAYESEPGQSITAVPIYVPPLQFSCTIQPHADSSMNINWIATPGATYRVQISTNLSASFADYSSDIVPTSGADASPVAMTFALNAPTNSATFWRVVRIH